MNPENPAKTGATGRPPPEIIRVPPPDGPASSPKAFRIVCTVFALLALGLAVIGTAGFRLGRRRWLPLLVLGGILVATTILIALIRSWQNRSYEKMRREFLARQPLPPLPNTTEAELSALWTKAWSPPKVELITAALHARTQIVPAARIICLGMVDVPEIGEFYFEPEIITPTRFYGRQLIFVPIALGIILLWILQMTRVIPGRVINPGSFGYLIGMGVSVGVSWFWRTAVRPTYLRMAPGVIEVLQFRHRKAKPLIRSYPMLAGTLAIIRGGRSRSNSIVHTITLVRATQKDDLPMHRMHDRQRCIERAWQALCSTAHTPPLPDDALIG